MVFGVVGHAHTGQGHTLMGETTLIQSSGLPDLLKDFYFKKCKNIGHLLRIIRPKYNVKYIYSKFRPLKVNLDTVFHSSLTFLPLNVSVILPALNF